MLPQPNCFFNREIRSEIPELTTSGFADSQARDKDAETKQRRTDYADERRGAQENSLATGGEVLMKQRKENKIWGNTSQSYQ